MMFSYLRNAAASLLACAMLLPASAIAQGDVIGFGSDRWILDSAEIVDHMDRKCLIGFAYLKDVAFEDGVIEVDVAVNGRTSYPGFVFRLQSEQEYESIYLRPHRADRYPDAVQYTPVFHGISGWQLYNGEGFTAGTSLPADQWTHLKLEVARSQARLFIGEAAEPALVINNLKHGVSKGAVGLSGPMDRTAFFSNFQVRADSSLAFDPAPPVETSPGMITKWDLSQVFRIGQLDMERSVSEQEIGEIAWEEVESEASGLVDIARHVGRTGREPDVVFAKTTVHADADGIKRFVFGYSDAASVFLNDKILFTGTSAYRQREPSFLGIVGLFDSVYLPLKKGENELVFMVAESFGGWGLICQDATAVYQHEKMQIAFETAKAFLTPESIVYDPARDVLYVSNYDVYGSASQEGGQFLSRLSTSGEIVDLKWITGLQQPTGMAVFGDRLFAVERGAVAEIDTESGEIVRRLSAPGSRFLNDIAIDGSGAVYISDSGGNAIYKLVDGQFEEWLRVPEIAQPNGLQIDGGALIVGNNGDRRLKAVDLATKSVRTIAQLGSGIIDGIQVAPDGNYLISHWQGRIYRVTRDGAIEKLLDTTSPGVNIADFEYVNEKGLFVVPTFTENRVVGYRLGE